MQAASRTGTKDFMVPISERMVGAIDAAMFGKRRALGSRIDDHLTKVVRGRPGKMLVKTPQFVGKTCLLSLRLPWKNSVSALGMLAQKRRHFCGEEGGQR